MTFCFLAILLVAAKPVERRITLDVREADVHDVLRLLADVGQVNLVVADGVKGRVTVKLRNVPWSEALDVVLRSQGLGQERTGSIIRVDTLGQLTEDARLRAEVKQLRQKAAPLQTIIIPVRYAKARDLAPLVESMLSSEGRVVIDERTNVLVVTDRAERNESIRRRVTSGQNR